MRIVNTATGNVYYAVTSGFSTLSMNCVPAALHCLRCAESVDYVSIMERHRERACKAASRANAGVGQSVRRSKASNDYGVRERDPDPLAGSSSRRISVKARNRQIAAAGKMTVKET